MSHFVKVQTQINDLAALKMAAVEMGFKVEENASIRGYYGLGQTCELVVKLKGRYDVGFNKQEDGTYGMVCDWFAGYVEEEIGKNGGQLLQGYTYQKVAKEAGQRGYTVQKSMEKDGKMKIRVGGF
jgi:hypothetical protein